MNYWPQTMHNGAISHGYMLTGRAELAFKLIATYGAIAAERGETTASGHPTLELQSPQELVERCFEIAELFFKEVESRGWIKSFSSEDYAEMVGKLEAIIQKSASETFIDGRPRKKS